MKRFLAAMKREEIKRLTCKLVSNIMLVVLAGDLLYLYFVGAWYDPIAAIEVVEVIALIGLVFWGLIMIVKAVRETRRWEK